MKKIFLGFIITIFILITSKSAVLADIGAGLECTTGGEKCIKGYSCQPAQSPPPDNLCQEDAFGDVFGKIKTPEALKNLVDGQPDPTGAKGISQFLTNLIALFYSIAAIVLVFMLIWGAWDWLTSGGEKDKIEAARNKIINAIIGIILFAIAFAIIQILGQFTGFTFFTPNTPSPVSPGP